MPTIKSKAQANKAEQHHRPGARLWHTWRDANRATGAAAQTVDVVNLRQEQRSIGSVDRYEVSAGATLCDRCVCGSYWIEQA